MTLESSIVRQLPRKVLIVQRERFKGYKLLSRELCTPRAIANAKAAGLRIARRRDVSSVVLSGLHDMRDEAEEFADFGNCDPITYQGLARLAQRRRK